MMMLASLSIIYFIYLFILLCEGSSNATIACNRVASSYVFNSKACTRVMVPFFFRAQEKGSPPYNVFTALRHLRHSHAACQASKTAFRSHCARPTGRYIRPTGVLSEFRAARTCASYWFDKHAALAALVCGTLR